MKNKRLHTPRPRGAEAPATPAKPAAPQASARTPAQKAKEIQDKIHRLEVEIASAPRLAQEHYLRNRDMVPPPDAGTRGERGQRPERLTHAQLAAKRRLKMLLLVEYLIGLILVLGAAAWAYKGWLHFTGQ